MKIQINITKEVLFMTRYCGHVPVAGEKFFQNNHCDYIIGNRLSLNNNCAITYAVQKLFPYAATSPVAIYFFKNHPELYRNFYCYAFIPLYVSEFIKKFDYATTEERLRMQPFSFQIKIPEKVIDLIGINEIHKELKESSTMDLVELHQ